MRLRILRAYNRWYGGIMHKGPIKAWANSRGKTTWLNLNESRTPPTESELIDFLRTKLHAL